MPVEALLAVLIAMLVFITVLSSALWMEAADVRDFYKRRLDAEIKFSNECFAEKQKAVAEAAGWKEQHEAAVAERDAARDENQSMRGRLYDVLFPDDDDEGDWDFDDDEDDGDVA